MVSQSITCKVGFSIHCIAVKKFVQLELMEKKTLETSSAAIMKICAYSCLPLSHVSAEIWQS